jgi:hypothetical protein
MQEPTHAPGWRGRPRRFGPIHDDSPPRSCLELVLYAVCYSIGAGTLAIGVLAWTADLFAGHIR